MKMKMKMKMKIYLMLLINLCGLMLFSVQVEAARGIQIIGKTDKVINTPVINGKYRALIIGNNEYQDAEKLWSPLKTAVADAESVADTLKKYYGFHDITLLLNGKRRDIIKSINNIVKSSNSSDSVLIFYAGHGYLNQKTNEGYWIPIDAEGKDDSTYIRNSTIKSKLAVLSDKARHVLLISDSCFSGALLRQANRGINLDDKNKQYIEKVSKKKSVQVLAAGGLEFVDDDYKSSKHSPFTYYFLSQLNHNNQQYFTATELSGEVKRSVATNVSQIPENGVLYGAGHDGGEFVFKMVNFNKKIIPNVSKQPKNSQSDSGKLVLSSSPNQAKWYLDGDYMGKTPDQMDDIKIGKHLVEVRKKGFNVYQESIRIRHNKTITLSALLEKTAQSSINATLIMPPVQSSPALVVAQKMKLKNRPAGKYVLNIDAYPHQAKIRILNIKPVYKENLFLYPGRYHVEVSLPGYVKWKKWIYLLEFDKSVSVELKKHKKIKRVTERHEPIKKHKITKVWKNSATGLSFVKIPGGCFKMGSNRQEFGRRKDEKLHKVCVKSFYMGQFEVTNKQYQLFKPNHDSGFFNPKTTALVDFQRRGKFKKMFRYAKQVGEDLISNRTPDKSFDLNKPNQPVVNISMKNVADYLHWLREKTGKKVRIPTEAEWEYAARANNRAIWYWGNNKKNNCTYANVYDQTAEQQLAINLAVSPCRDNYVVSAPVGRFKPNNFGLYDMIGNVFEMTCSVYRFAYQGNEMKCVRSRMPHVVRGGSWDRPPMATRIAKRALVDTKTESYNLGLRLVVTE